MGRKKETHSYVLRISAPWQDMQKDSRKDVGRFNEQARRDMLREYKRKFANLSDDLRLIRLCSDAGFMKTVARGQYFVILDEAELATLDGSCREHTLTRDDQFSKKKDGPWKHEDRSVLEVTVSCHQGRFGIEIRINSLFGDGSHSWVMIGNGLNKYVTEPSVRRHLRKPQR